ncbi:uncharacterized protein A4U43_C04F28670 [Asparagus officinalis]|uniref:F-box/LRR-repeat protein 15/At3g58940/PEG3-like LRR domain-containing protein n=1 Tax=Asparagus officinalis TaxID=4686 RepID=A0A5P1F738_ASPOF|nr:uncharacterized protein A4U43_C04F28670 [Asparagus officinalis]
MTFVERVLLFSDATNLNCVSITTRGGCDMFRVLSWIYTIMKRNVRDLTIYHQQKELLKLPLKIFHLQSLKRLSVTVLHHQILTWPHPQPSASTLAALEDLTLSGFKFVNTARDSISSSCPHLKIWKMKRCTDLYQLDVNCPNLEIFRMHECKGLRDLVVSGPSLMTINIRDTFVHAGKGSISTLEISAPNLRKFIWSDKPVHRYKSSKMFPSCADVRLRSFGGRDLFLSLNETRHLIIDCFSLWVCSFSSFFFTSLP